jgi:phosphopantothenoylcysteine decarboxylase/phosphopantothenate--cysteine ligase
MISGKRIVVGVTGGIAAYKAADLCSRLGKLGVQVRVAMTDAATRFVGPLTFETLTRHAVYTSVLDRPASWEMEHISWAKWGDLLLVAPASANTLAKMAHGLADDPVSSLYLSFGGPVAVAPAMNTVMWEHPATQANLDMLRSRGVAVIEPDSGMLACGDAGAGKLAAVDRIVEFLETETGLWDQSRANQREAGTEGRQDASGTTTVAKASPILENPAVPSAPTVPDSAPADATVGPPDETLKGRRVLITSGPTHEFLDPVRFITNPSSGRMGGALAREAARRGATVDFVSGPVSLALLPSDCATVHKVTTAEQMLNAVRGLASDVDVFVFCAAVSDFRVANPPTHKIKRTGNSLSLLLVENPDIAQAVGFIKKPSQVTVGFAAETNDLETNARGKMERKHLDAIVANDVANPRIGFESAENEVTIYLRTGDKRFVARAPKETVAREIFDTIVGLLETAKGM